MRILRQSTQIVVLFGPYVDKTDGVTAEVGLGAAATEISKAGVGFGAGPTLGTHDSDGWYPITLTTTHTNTLGNLTVKGVDDATHLPVWEHFTVVNTALFDALCASSGGAIPNAVAGAAGGVFIAGTNAATTITTGLTTTFTGNLTGSVASVTGAVGSVTGLTASNLDATISSRMATYVQPTGFLAATFPAGTIANTTNITGGTITTTTNLTTNNDKTGYSLTQAFPTNFADLAITVTTGRVTVGTNADKTGYSISGTKTTLDALNDIAATAIVSAGAITTLAGAVVNVDLVDTLTTYTGNTVQTGDSYALVNGASGVVAIKADTAAVKTQTDKLVFTVAGKVDANTTYLNGKQMTGDGSVALPWGPA